MVDPAGPPDYEALLAPWAAHASRPGGRLFAEEEDPHRSRYQRDRDRIVHCSAFRRLESKTQVYTHLYQEGDYFRKRLTHTLEVAQIARSLARSLRLNEDLTEAVALAHDLGHAPFGHTGQEILHNLMRNDGGFEHNVQSFRIICVIERRYPDFSGLNLTYEVREAIAKRGKRQIEPMSAEYTATPHPSLEAQVVDMADPITYTAHDLDDGITARTISLKLLKNCTLWAEGEAAVNARYSDLTPKLLKYQVIRHIINVQITDLLEQTAKNIGALKPKSIDDVRNAAVPLCGFSPTIEKKHRELKTFLRTNMYDNHKVKVMEYKATRVITDLFDLFLENPHFLPPNVQPHFNQERERGNEKRIVCDYIAGMTDRYALEEHNKFFNPTSRV